MFENTQNRAGESRNFWCRCDDRHSVWIRPGLSMRVDAGIPCFSGWKTDF